MYLNVIEPPLFYFTFPSIQLIPPHFIRQYKLVKSKRTFLMCFCNFNTRMQEALLYGEVGGSWLNQAELSFGVVCFDMAQGFTVTQYCPCFFCSAIQAHLGWLGCLHSHWDDSFGDRVYFSYWVYWIWKVHLQIQWAYVFLAQGYSRVQPDQDPMTSCIFLYISLVIHAYFCI